MKTDVDEASVESVVMRLSEQKAIACELVVLKEKAARCGLYRTARMIEIAVQEVGWEMQGSDTPEWQKRRQQETLTP